MTQTLDDKDIKIIEVLKEHAEYTTRQIAKKTLFPVTTIHNRIKKLRKEGVIRKYTIKIDNSKIGKNFVSYILISVNLHMLKQKHKTQHDLAAELKKLYFVERADIVTGGVDIVAIIRVRDIAEFDDCLLNKLQMIEGIDKTQTLTVIHSR